MTDDRLISLLEERPPEELTGDELVALRGRLAESPAVREALVSQLRLEQTLHQTVGQFRLPVELLLAKAAAIQTTAGVAKLFGWGSMTALLLGVVSVGTLTALRGDRPQPAARPIALAKLVQEPASPSDIDRRGGVSASRRSRRTKPVAQPNNENARTDDGPIIQPAEADSGEVYFADAEAAALWRESLESLAGDVSQRSVDNRAELVLRGTRILRHAWPSAGRMRLKLAGHDRFKIHLSYTSQPNSGPRAAASRTWPTVPSSLTLEFFARPGPLWVAWIAARRANQTLPEALALAAHDAGRLSQLGAGTIDLGYHDGQLSLTHGSSELLAAPLAGPPDLVVFEGDAVVQGLAFAEGLAATNSAVASFDSSTPRPAERQWQVDLPAAAKWNLLAEGRVELLAEDSQEPAQVACPLPEAKQHEIVFQLEDPLPGTGIFLGDEHGQVRCSLGFIATDRASQVCFAFGKQGEPLRPADGPLPLCPPRPWFKLSFAVGMVKAWFSCDGAHWSPLLNPEVPLDGTVATAGIYCLPGPGTRSIRVAQFAMGEPAAPAVAAPELFGQVTAPAWLPLALLPMTKR